MRIKRALTVSDLRAYKATTLDFEHQWLECIGRPELTGAWLVWGNSANGKTRFAVQLAKYLATFCKVAYNSLEEGRSQSMRQAVINSGMADVQRSFLFLDKEPISELAARLRRRKSPDAIIIDSIQYSGLTYAEYKRLRDEFRNKLFIMISHAEGREPKGNVARSVRYDAFVKIYVEGYKAFPQSRYGGGNEYVIWPKGAQEYWDYK
jgi:hypothetical protein